MTINDKIKQILIDKNLSPSYFADEIGVQRSSISHILSGRNRPSFDIIQKIIRRFPDLGYEWIMEEENQPMSQPVYNNRGVNRPLDDRNSLIPNGQPSGSYTMQPSGVRSQRTEIPPLSSPAPIVTESIPSPSVTQMGLSTATPADKKVERILIFYSDGSFREYMPSL